MTTLHYNYYFDELALALLTMMLNMAVISGGGNLQQLVGSLFVVETAPSSCVTITAAQEAVVDISQQGCVRQLKTDESGLRWSSFYGVNASVQRGWVNLAIIDSGADLFHQQRQLESYERYKIPALLPMPEHGVFQRRTTSVPSGLAAGWQDVLAKWAAEFVLPRMRNGSVLGVFVGDEICCHNSSCWEDQLVPITSELRQLLGPKAILYENDCTDSIAGANDSFHCQEPRGCPPICRIAPALDFVSVDYYTGYGPNNIHGENGTAEADGVRAFYLSTVYPKLYPHQRTWVVPGVFACSNFTYMPLLNSSRSVLAKLEAYFEWAKADSRVAGINPWHFARRSHAQHPPPCDMMLGAVDMPDVMKFLRSMGEWIQAHHLTAAIKSDDALKASSLLPPFGEHQDAEWWTCAQRCKDPHTGKPTPELCSSLNPQPNNTWEIVAPQAGGERDHFIYGANGSEWRQWMRPAISGGKVTAMPTFNGWSPGYSLGSNAGFLCEAHRQGIRVMDADTLLDLYSPFSLTNHDIFNESAMVIWAEAVAHFMISAGLDGFSIDLENAFYTFMATDASARAAFISALVRLKSRMQAVLPGSLLAVWIAAGGAPWSHAFTNEQMATVVETVDQFWIMNYAMCGHPYADLSGGMSNDPLPFINSMLNQTLALGIPADQLVSGFPWFNCNFDCGEKGNSQGGVNCSRLRPKEFCPGPNATQPPYKFCFDNVTDVGYAQTLPLIAYAQAQGNSIEWDSDQATNYVNYFNHSNEHYYQLWYDDPKSLSLKYKWAAEKGLRGIGMWTPSSTLFDENASRAMWAVVPTSAEATTLRQWAQEKLVSRAKTDDVSGDVQSQQPQNTTLFVHSTRTADGDFFPCTRVPSALAVPGSLVRLALAECRRWIGDGCEPNGLPAPKDPDQGDRYVCLRRSVDGGATFGALQANITNTRGTNPSAVWDLHAGAVRVFFSSNTGIHSVLSSDLGVSWARPMPQTTVDGQRLLGSVGPGNGVISTRLSNGTLLLALASHSHHTEPMGTPIRTFDSYVYTSTLGGDAGWRRSRATLPYIGETQLVALQDKTIMLNSRCADGGHGPGHPPKQHYFTPCHCHNRAIAISSDAGESFGSISFDKGLPDPDCQGAIVRLDGDPQGRVAFSNPASRHGRTNMTLHLSLDASAISWRQPGMLLSAAAAAAPPYQSDSLGAYSALMSASHKNTSVVGTVWEGGHAGCDGPSCAIFVSWSVVPTKTDDGSTGTAPLFESPLLVANSSEVEGSPLYLQFALKVSFKPVSATRLKSDEILTITGSAGAPPQLDAYFHCVEHCSNMSLCASMSPQPHYTTEIVATVAGAARNGFAYGENGSEWRHWLPTHAEQVTIVPVFNSLQGLGSGINEGLICEAHRHNIRVVDEDCVNGGFKLEFVTQPHQFANESAVDIWVEKVAHFMLTVGIDGITLDWEGSGPNEIYGLMDTNATLRQGMTDTLRKLKAAMQRAVPGSALSVWIGSYGNPWTPAFSAEQLASAVASVDLFLFMDYSDCGQHNTGMANSNLPYIQTGFNFTVNTLGFPRDQLVAVWPWWGCDFNCGPDDVNCAGLQYDCGGKNCQNNVTAVGYEQLLPSLALSQSQGVGRQWNSTWASPFYNYKNNTSADYHQVWFDDKDSLKSKYSWSLAAGMRGVGMWVPGATLFDDKATADMWSTVPHRVPAMDATLKATR